jgi:predicted phage tail protein
MTNVYLHGELRNLFGDYFKLNINSPKEAFSAINANRRNFAETVKKLGMKGILYRIIVDDEVTVNIKELGIQKAPKEMHIVPVVWGAGSNSGGILMLAAGVAMVALTAGAAAGALPAMLSAFGTGGSMALTTATGLTTLGSVVTGLGVSLAIQGAMSLLFPQPKPDFNQEVAAGGKSYLFGSKPSNTSQGQAVPVGYGRLLIGASQVSSTTNHYPLNSDIKTLMTPESSEVDDYISLKSYDEGDNLSWGSNFDGFSSNQSSYSDESDTTASISVSNSYVNVTTTSSNKIVSDVIEVTVKKDGKVISNPLLDTFNENISYDWKEVSSSANGAISREDAVSFKEGLVYRYYEAPKYTLKTDNTKTNTSVNFFNSYTTGTLVKWGPLEFKELTFSQWDSGYKYVQKELVKYNDGSEDRYFQSAANSMSQKTIASATRAAGTVVSLVIFTAVVTVVTTQAHGFVSNAYIDISGLKGRISANGKRQITVVNPTTFTFPIGYSIAEVRNQDFGSETYDGTGLASPSLDSTQPPIISGSVNTTFWTEITAPAEQRLYKALRNNSAVIPHLAASSSDWSYIVAATDSGTLNTVTNLFPAYTKQDIYNGPLSTTSYSSINNTGAQNVNYDNYLMEFLGYFYVPIDSKKIIPAISTVATKTYEITRVGTTDWAALGLIGTAKIGSLFTRNSATLASYGTGKALPTTKYVFKIDCDDSADLYIDEQIAHSNYGVTPTAENLFGGHGFAFPTTNAAIGNLGLAGDTELNLTSGYHRLYARFQEGLGSEGISLYYKYKLNTDSTYTNYEIVPKEKLWNKTDSDEIVPIRDKFLTKNSNNAYGSINFAASANRLSRFVAKRPQNSNNGLVTFDSKWVCTASIGSSIKLTTAPVSVYIKFNPTNSK